ncbi:MAG: hypothetical protein ACK5V3_13410 [Bdellovibrionales bacterium]
MKNHILSFMTLLLSLGIMSGSFAQRSATAARQDLVPGFQLNRTQNLNGKYIHAIYAIQKAGFIGVTPVPHLEKIRVVQTQKVQTNSVIFNTVTIEKEPFRASYHVEVSEVTEKPQVRWANPDQSASTDYSYLTKVEKPSLDLFIKQQGEAAIFGISL